MIAPLPFAAALDCAGGYHLELGGSYITIDPPPADQRACIYQRSSGGEWRIFLFTVCYRLNEALCKAIRPELEFGRIEIPQQECCPPDPEAPKAVEVKVQ